MAKAINKTSASNKAAAKKAPVSKLKKQPKTLAPRKPKTPKQKSDVQKGTKDFTFGTAAEQHAGYTELAKTFYDGDKVREINSHRRIGVVTGAPQGQYLYVEFEAADKSGQPIPANVHVGDVVKVTEFATVGGHTYRVGDLVQQSKSSKLQGKIVDFRTSKGKDIPTYAFVKQDDGKTKQWSIDGLHRVVPEPDLSARVGEVAMQPGDLQAGDTIYHRDGSSGIIVSFTPDNKVCVELADGDVARWSADDCSVIEEMMSDREDDEIDAIDPVGVGSIVVRGAELTQGVVQSFTDDGNLNVELDDGQMVVWPKDGVGKVHTAESLNSAGWSVVKQKIAFSSVNLFAAFTFKENTFVKVGNSSAIKVVVMGTVDEPFAMLATPNIALPKDAKIRFRQKDKVEAFAGAVLTSQ